MHTCNLPKEIEIMDINEILNDKDLKPSEKTEMISKMLVGSEIALNDLIRFAKSAKDPAKATCIEAIEYTTKNNPAMATGECLAFVSETLSCKAPRVKWESARVIGNIAHVFPDKLDTAIKNLLANTEHPGTVVRWSAAYALGEIIKTKHKKIEGFIPAIEAICEREEKNSIRKIYLDALKKTKR